MQTSHSDPPDSIQTDLKTFTVITPTPTPPPSRRTAQDVVGGGTTGPAAAPGASPTGSKSARG